MWGSRGCPYYQRPEPGPRARYFLCEGLFFGVGGVKKSNKKKKRGGGGKKREINIFSPGKSNELPFKCKGGGHGEGRGQMKAGVRWGTLVLPVPKGSAASLPHTVSARNHPWSRQKKKGLGRGRSGLYKLEPDVAGRLQKLRVNPSRDSRKDVRGSTLNTTGRGICGARAVLNPAQKKNWAIKTKNQAREGTRSTLLTRGKGKRGENNVREKKLPHPRRARTRAKNSRDEKAVCQKSRIKRTAIKGSRPNRGKAGSRKQLLDDQEA